MITLPQPLGAEQIAGLLDAALHDTFVDRGATRFHYGAGADGRPFLLMVNTVDGTGFMLDAVTRLRPVAANDHI